jgi:hypothetical protein
MFNDMRVSEESGNAFRNFMRDQVSVMGGDRADAEITVRHVGVCPHDLALAASNYCDLVVIRAAAARSGCGSL